MRSLILVALGLLMVAALAPGQSDSGADQGISFRGQVRYDNNTPAAFIPVELWTDGETTWRRYVTTDRAGKFHVGAPCMWIKYKIDVAGYQPVEGQLYLTPVPCRAFEDITLKAIDARVAAIPPEAKKEFDDGAKAVNHNDFANAIPHLEKAVGIYPKYAEAYQLLGVAQLQMKQGPQAESSLLKAIEIEARMPRAQYLLGVLYAMTGRAQLAESPLTRFSELDPYNPEAHFELAKVSFALNKFPDAETHARKAIDLKESNKGVYIVLGYALLRQKKADEAKRAFQQFLKYDPKSPMVDEVNTVIAQIDRQAGN